MRLKQFVFFSVLCSNTFTFMQISWLAFSILKLHVLNFSCRSIRGLVVTVVDGGAVKTAVVALSAPVIGSLSIM